MRSDLNFSRVVVGDEPPPFTLRAAYQGVEPSTVELLIECDQFQIGSTLEDAICANMAVGSLRAAIVPFPADGVSEQFLAQTSTALLVSAPGTMLLSHGQWGIGRGGPAAQIELPVGDEFLFLMTSAASGSYTYHRLLGRSDSLSYAVGGTIHQLPAAGSLTLYLNGTAQTFTSTGAFSFAQKIAAGTAYSVTHQEEGCAVADGEGSVEDNDIDNILVTWLISLH